MIYYFFKLAVCELNFSANFVDSGKYFLRFSILLSFEGCVLKNSGACFPTNTPIISPFLINPFSNIEMTKLIIQYRKIIIGTT